ncbi:M16 family metallopeptidase [Stackebrandtia nassauensis]|uniref:Peptidase M16 domain protein n=1 Tax=Stackebrandtia nassauensis (strain DSM 44728 / CIP 108903 / NRRL B-16338 / NBRC 102104 / LLR-40K-21) TaxID=446470 RepID=D3PYA6_STANL|nr:pitrilysin family protein [Stackebrandtia nassauensis]ADD41473.1 peptidase M16 domain protein [Stackebrandtia nassauensis DSM 44728]
MTVHTVPDLAPATEFTLPDCHERVLDNGLTILAIRRPSVPLVEVRLRLPFAEADVAVSSVMAQTIMSGTADKSIVDIAAELQSVGGGLSASVDPDRFLLAGNALVDGLPRLLATMSEVLHGATYPEDQVDVERERLADHINVARQQPGHLVQVALLKRMYGAHPYAVQTPEPEDVGAITPQQLLDLHAGRIHPAGATLVIVGDLPAEQALDAGAAALADWNGHSEPRSLEPVAPLTAGPVTFVDRPDSVQSSIRVALTALPRVHDDNAAQQLANLIYGGYFSSRLVANVRENKGYSYSPRSAVDHALAGSAVVISADVATEVTAPALWEVWYELGRIAATPPTEDELEQARRYALGTLRLGTATQSGLASLASSFAGWDLRPDWLLEHANRLASVTIEDVQRVAADIFAPAKAVTVVLGDAAHVKAPLEGLTHVEGAR